MSLWWFEPTSVELHRGQAPSKDALPTELPRRGSDKSVVDGLKIRYLFDLTIELITFWSWRHNLFLIWLRANAKTMSIIGPGAYSMIDIDFLPIGNRSKEIMRFVVLIQALAELFKYFKQAVLNETMASWKTIAVDLNVELVRLRIPVLERFMRAALQELKQALLKEATLMQTESTTSFNRRSFWKNARSQFRFTVF